MILVVVKTEVNWSNCLSASSTKSSMDITEDFLATRDWGRQSGETETIFCPQIDELVLTVDRLTLSQIDLLPMSLDEDKKTCKDSQIRTKENKIKKAKKHQH